MLSSSKLTMSMASTHNLEVFVWRLTVNYCFDLILIMTPISSVYLHVG